MRIIKGNSKKKQH